MSVSAGPYGRCQVAEIEVDGKPFKRYKFLSRSDFEALPVPEDR